MDKKYKYIIFLLIGVILVLIIYIFTSNKKTEPEPVDVAETTPTTTTTTSPTTEVKTQIPETIITSENPPSPEIIEALPVTKEEIVGLWNVKYKSFSSTKEERGIDFEPTELLETDLSLEIKENEDGGLSLIFKPIDVKVNGKDYPENTFDPLEVVYAGTFENGELKFRSETEAFFLYSETPMEVNVSITKTSDKISGSFEHIYQKTLDTYELKNEIIFEFNKI